MSDPKDWRVEVTPHVSPPEPVSTDRGQAGIPDTDPANDVLPWDPMDEVKGA